MAKDIVVAIIVEMSKSSYSSQSSPSSGLRPYQVRHDSLWPTSNKVSRQTIGERRRCLAPN
ncbi:hypothetical protein ACS0TY_027328 [Phlomoides rotata]